MAAAREGHHSEGAKRLAFRCKFSRLFQLEANDVLSLSMTWNVHMVYIYIYDIYIYIYTIYIYIHYIYIYICIELHIISYCIPPFL